MSSEVVVKQNNFVQDEKEVMQQMRYLFVAESLLGVNRLYLCGYRKIVLWSSYVYSVALSLCVGIFVLYTQLFSDAQDVYKKSLSVEYLLLGFNGLLLQKNKLFQFFSSLKSFDEYLKIQNEISITAPTSWYLYGIGAVLIYNICEIMFCMFSIFYSYDLTYTMGILYIPVVIHDLEIVFFSYLFGLILIRLSVIRAHVSKVISRHDNTDQIKKNKIIFLANKGTLDISSIHNAYDSLHDCCEKVNSIMSFSMIVLVAATGLSTIMILKNAISIMRIPHDFLSPTIIRSIVIFAIGRCVKSIVLLIFPCYISNKTKYRVATIRSMIYDSLNSKNVVSDKIERRKLKAFLQLTRENEFTYALWGVVKLDMSFPLSFSSLCTTYLIIAVQFSKFFD